MPDGSPKVGKEIDHWEVFVAKKNMTLMFIGFCFGDTGQAVGVKLEIGVPSMNLYEALPESAKPLPSASHIMVWSACDLLAGSGWACLVVVSWTPKGGHTLMRLQESLS